MGGIYERGAEVMTTEALKCADLVRAKMQEREEELGSLAERAEESEYYGDEEALHEIALSIDTKSITTICLSYGGPADYLEVLHTKGEIERVVYRYSDWFDTATHEVEEGSYLYQYAQMIMEGVES
jgi:hypothetical protein